MVTGGYGKLVRLSFTMELSFLESTANSLGQLALFEPLQAGGQYPQPTIHIIYILVILVVFVILVVLAVLVVLVVLIVLVVLAILVRLGFVVGIIVVIIVVVVMVLSLRCLVVHWCCWHCRLSATPDLLLPRSMVHYADFVFLEKLVGRVRRLHPKMFGHLFLF